MVTGGTDPGRFQSSSTSFRSVFPHSQDRGRLATKGSIEASTDHPRCSTRESESAWESVLRVLHQAAVPIEPQYEILDEYGRFLARADLWIKGTRRIHEYDGAVHREAEMHQKDLKRDRNLIMSDWQRFGFTSAQLLNEGATIIKSVDSLLGRPWDSRRLHGWEELLNESMLRRPVASEPSENGLDPSSRPESGHSRH
jgi:very-short-patch-repair endonuclease